ncbi:MAG: ATP-binding protein [Caldiserica bacterium]|jgi:PAS domain S-box-containing protein|nr:ATP-binding protein [Caldisericota bacterium]MDH7562461.1 ATP-binding protein [Caldisericota bacterium]
MGKRGRSKRETNSEESPDSREVLVFAIDSGGRIKWGNSPFLGTCSLKEECLSQVKIQDLISPRFRKEFQNHLENDGTVKNLRVPFLVGGKEVTFSLSGENIFFPGNEEERVFWAFKDLEEKSRKIRAAFFSLLGEVLTSKGFQGFFKTLHSVLKNLIPAPNFYVALYDEERDLISFPYIMDNFRRTRRVSRKRGRGLTEWILGTGKPLLLKTREEFEEMVKSGKVEVFGKPPESWLGVPLMVNGKARGVIAVQTYEKDFAFSEDHLEILSLLSGSLSALILRFRYEESERDLREKISLLFRNIPDPLYLKDLKGRYRMINPAFSKALDLPESEILGKKASDLFDPEFSRNVAQSDRQLLNSGETSRIEETLTFKGKTRVYETIKTLTRNAKGKPTGILGISRDITDKKILEERLESARRDLLYAISHEFKSPLTFLFSACEVLKNCPQEEIPAVYQRWSEPLERNLKRLKRLVDNLMDSLRVREAKYPLSLGPSDLPTIIKECWEEQKPIAQSKNIETSFEIGEIPVLNLDREAMGRVVGNLLSNAVKFSPKNSQILIRLFKEEDVVTLQVRDQGVGIPEDELESIFQPFFRSRHAHKKGFPGTGLGLYVSRKIVEAHGGTLTLASDFGKGTTVTVRLPIKVPGEENFPGTNSR